MGTPEGHHERPADDDVADDIDQTVTLRVEDQTNRDLEGVGAGSAAGLDDEMAAVEMRVVEMLFGRPAGPSMLGRYVVLGPLGRGGMGTVLEAFDRTLDRKVAIKVLHEDLGQEHNARLLREAQAMAKLSHPNVVQVFEADTVDGQTFVAMERVQGQTLRQWIRQTPPPDWRECVEVFIQAGQGLAAAHAEGLIHRDFKPSNALIDDQGRVRVLDFGLARRTEIELAQGPSVEGEQTEDNRSRGAARRGAGRGTTGAWPPDEPALDQALTTTGMVLGTPAYMPPEQFKGHEADARSDQFSFCVSLFEAVYGKRPFAGGTLTTLMASMTDGTMRPVPKGSPVPARLHALLLRGLAFDPDQRWPSMDTLLHQLRMLVAPRTRRWMTLGVTTGLAALGGGLALGQYAQVKDRCTGAPVQMDGIWDDDRRGRVQAALLDTGRSFAPDTWERLEPRLDGYARAWMNAHTEVCEATSVRGEQSHEALDLRMRCLDRRLTALRATIDVLIDADAEVVHNAVELAAGLPTLTRCDDLGWLERRDQLVPPAEDPNVATAVEAQRARLADIGAMARAGRYPEALDEVEAVVQQAEALGYPPLRAEALLRRGDLRKSNGQYARAEEDLRQAHALGVRHHHDPVALDAAQILTSMVGYDLARYAEGLQWGEMEALPLAQRSGEPLEEAGSSSDLGGVFVRQAQYEKARVHLERALAIEQEVLGLNHPDVAHTLNRLGGVFTRQGNDEQARVHFERALAIQERALGPGHPDVAQSLNSLGGVFGRQGDMGEARAHLERALAIRKQALGPDHPDVARSLSTLGNVSFIQGDLDDAGLYFERALAIQKQALGSDHPDVAHTLSNLGSVSYRKGDLEDAQVRFERVLAIQEKTLGPDHPDVAGSLNNLGGVYGLRGALDESRAHLERALAIEEKALGPDHPDVAMSVHNLGSVFHRQGDLDNARVYFERALAIHEKTQGPDHPEVAYSLLELAKVALETGDRESARARAERAVSIREATTVEPSLLAEARFVLALALWSTRRERSRARALAEQARDALVAAQGPGEAELDVAEVKTWLVTHRVR